MGEQLKGIAAALLFFTRLPLWRLKSFKLPAKYFENVINYWAIMGWFTGGTMVATLWLSVQVLPFSIAVFLALLSRLLLTGALHEDGLADFFDGFGGATNRQRILEIMKDSHIGTYGVLALVLYFLAFFEILQSFSVANLCVLLLVADAFSKFLVSTITLFLPYARTKEMSKSGMVYTKMKMIPFTLSLFGGLFPLLLLPDWHYLFALFFPVIVFFILIRFLKIKIQGYTGDTCGALFLLCEFSAWLGFAVVMCCGL